MSGIRVTYSGLISFAVGITSIVTGIIFTLIVTRQLSSEELGTWTLIGGLISYVIITESTISYWVTREIARGIDSGKTAIVTSGVLSVIGMIVFMIIIYIGADQFNVEKSILVLGVIMIPVILFDRTVSAINLGWKPQAVSYAILVFESSKIPVGLTLVYFMQMGVSGAIYATFFGYLLSSLVSLFIARKKITKKIRIDLIKKWIKLSWLTYYPQLSNLISRFDVLIYTLIVGSVTGLAYYTAAFSIAALVMQSGNISRAIYPKLLEDENRGYFQENLIRVFYFLILLTAISLTFVKPALFALNPLYENVVLIAIFMIIRMIFVTMTGVFYTVLSGIEKVDISEKSNFKDYIKSRLFTLPTISLIQACVYVITLTVGLFFMYFDKSGELEYVTYWSIVALITEVPFTIYLYLKVKKHFTLELDHNSLLKYIISSIGVFGLVYWLTNEFLEFKVSIFEFLPNLLLFVLIGVISYLIVTYIIDERTRKLFHAIIKEVKIK